MLHYLNHITFLNGDNLTFSGGAMKLIYFSIKKKKKKSDPIIYFIG